MKDESYFDQFYLPTEFGREEWVSRQKDIYGIIRDPRSDFFGLTSLFLISILMSISFREKDQLTISLLLVLVVGLLGFRFLSVNSFFQNPERSAVEYELANARAYQFELDLNEAQWHELTLLPGIGERLGKRIVEYRNQYQRFNNIDELIHVDGIGPKKLEAIRKFLRVDREHHSTTIDRNGV